jgi:hypothetical protein
VAALFAQLLNMSRPSLNRPTSPTKPTPVPSLPDYVPPSKGAPPKPTPVAPVAPYSNGLAAPKTGRSTLLGGGIASDTPAQRKTLLGQ